MAEDWLKTPYALESRTIWVAGHTGLVGSALVERLKQESCEILTIPRTALDLRIQAHVTEFLQDHKPDIIALCAATVGGILANATRPAEFLYDNLMMTANVIHGAYGAKVPRLLFLGSSCIYPREAEQPITENALLSGPLEPTNEAYALAKIAGLKLVETYRKQYGCDFISVMPCNLYGPKDRFDLQNSHVIPALMMKFHEAKMKNAPEVIVWGTGAPLREFLYIDDLAEALVFCLKHYTGEQSLNLGAGVEVSIRELAGLMSEITGYRGRIVFDLEKPDGTPRKVMDSRRITEAGWRATTDLKSGLQKTYAWYTMSVRV